ncbi:MAG TPA: hypothetical protein VF645_12550 [Allosphingosinicella sp.]|jgi:hypothetical protein
MDAPKGRYRVEEKDGRLTVIDTATGAPASPVSAAKPGVAPKGPGTVSAPPGLADRYGRLLLGLVVNRWAEDGRAILAWEWEENGRTERWDAVLGRSEQKRLGRALVAVFAFPILVLVSIFAGFGPAFLLVPIALPATLWGVWAIGRLKRETGSG